MENVPTNTNGAISNAVNNAVQRKTPAQMMNSILGSDATKKLLQETCKENAGAFAASILDIYTNDKQLQKYDPKLVFLEAMKAASLKLPINKNLGFAWIVPYKNVPTFQIGYKGYVQLAIRTGKYKYINAGKVYDGEIKSFNKISGEVDLSGEPKSDEVIGYFAYIETKDGYSKCLYWTKKQVIDHAQRYSMSYRSGNKIWVDNFDEMAMKTVLRYLLNHWGIMSTEMIESFNKDSDDTSEQTNEFSDEVPEDIVTADFEESNVN